MRIVFFVIFALNIIGSLFIYSDKGNNETLSVVLIGFAGFLFGIILGSKFLIKKSKKCYLLPTIGEMKNDSSLQNNAFLIILIIFIISFLMSVTLFVQKGIPLFSSNNNELRSSFGVGTQGRIRALVTWCPASGLMIFCLYLINKKFRKPTIVILGITLTLLALYSFKGNMLWFAMMLYLINTSIRKKIQFGKGLVYVGIVVLLLITVFSIWLSVEYSVAIDSLIKRITKDQVDGLDYIVTKYVPSIGFEYGRHFVTQFMNTMFSVYQESFDIQLAQLFYGRKVNWGIVQTLYGFLYFDFGRNGVFLGFVLMGMVVRKIENTLTNVDNLSITSLLSNVYLVYVLIKIFLVGNVFNEVKGLLLSLIVFNFFYLLLYSIVFRNGKILIKRRLTRNSAISFISQKYSCYKEDAYDKY